MLNSNQELRILHPKRIYPNTFGGNLRTLNIARLAREFFNRITVFSMDNTLEYQGMIDEIHICQEKEFQSTFKKICYYSHAITARELIIPYAKRAFINSENVIFQIENPRLYPLLRKNKISRYILDEHDVNWELLFFPQYDIKKQIYNKVAYKRDKENEKNALINASHVICCSFRDQNILLEEVPEIAEKISVIPNCVNIMEYDPIRRSVIHKQERQKSRILFVGTLSHPPNNDAVQLICRIIAKKSPLSIQYLIAGNNPPLIDHPDNVQFLGYVRDIKKVILDADICIAPIRFGSGTRLKILEYMAMGKPVISTSKGAEGIDYTDGLNIIIENRIEKYPEIIQQLIDDEKKRIVLGREARNLIEEKYDWEFYRKPLEEIYRQTMEDSS